MFQREYLSSPSLNDKRGCNVSQNHRGIVMGCHGGFDVFSKALCRAILCLGILRAASMLWKVRSIISC